MIFRIVFIALVPLIATALKESEIFEAINAAVIAVENRKHEVFLDDSKVCYEEIGCFTKTGPMKHVGTLPDSLEHINTRFFAYTSEAPTTAHEIHAKDTASHSVVAQAKPLAIIAHGFSNNGQTSYLLDLKTSLLKSGHVPTVIITDWTKGAAAPWYGEASVNTQVVGRQIANLVNHLKTSRGIDPAQVHLLGFSLGAQVSGYAGKFSQSEYKWKFGRISGELCFEKISLFFKNSFIHLILINE
jgi:predicted alpha/beta-fold hydrolase